ncbi:MAG: sulfatase [Treponema sp.]|nr:sulfatase [Treponema sp.]
MKTIFIMMDSLNRHYLNLYGDNRIPTPNIDRIAAKGVIFDNHYSGSLPCMPARRELMTGRYNFLEAPWGPIEPWDDCLPVELRTQKKTYSHLITDHYHYFHDRGDGYQNLFNSWEFERGQEADAWHPLVAEPDTPNFRGRNRRQYWANRQFMNSERDEDYSTPRCFMRAMEFLDKNGKEDNWHLHLEVFDPHEPFDAPKKYLQKFNDTWDNRYLFNWPEYQAVSKEEGPQAIAHIRSQYAAALTMADTWLGKFIDKMDELDLWKDTCVIFSTDHGHLLGEHGYWAKNYMFDYQELAHIPLIIHLPQTAAQSAPQAHQTKIAGRVTALTAAIDIMPTIMEMHGAVLPKDVHGKSLLHLLEKDAARHDVSHQDALHHDAVLYGYFGKDINMTDGRYTYCRQPLENSVAHHYTLMPGVPKIREQLERLQKAKTGRFLKHCHDIPHLDIEVPSHRHADAPDFNPIYDVSVDPRQEKPIHDNALEQKLAAKMKELMVRYDAPVSQFVRVGL